MPLYKGNKNINAIYKGTTQISAIYKGTKLVYSSAFWQSLLYSYLYNDLIPTTIDNKNVLDKAKVSKIYANGEVVNQQIIPTAIPATSTNNGITLTNNGDGSYTMSGTATAIATFVAYSAATLIKGHKYLEYFVPRGGSPSTYLGGDANGWLDPSDHGGTIANTTFSPNTATMAYYLCVMSGATVNFTWKPMLFDLTLMFGAGNEPTELTDKRIQNILNRGYIPYNTGEYKGTSISEFSSKDSNNVALDTLSFIYQGNGNDTTHDNYVLTKTSHIFTKNVDYVDETTMPTTRSTPQVITIPRKHLGIKKISSLTDWIIATAEGHRVFLTTQIRSGNNYLVYCKDYIYSNAGLSNMQIRTDTYFGLDYLYILDDSCSSVADFLAKRGDCYIFYETNAEVSDIADTISIEAGGSITSDSEVLPDVEFSVKCK